MEKYPVDEDEAYSRARLIEYCQIGDDIDDALYLLYSEGQPEKAFQELENLVSKMVNNLIQIKKRNWKLKAAA